MTTEEIVREQLGMEGPQLSTEAYEERINYELKYMTREEFLQRISDAIEKRLG